jgi:protease I
MSIMSKKLEGKTIAILATDGFEESELLSPKKALEDEGAHVEVISLKKGTIKSWKDGNWNTQVKVDRALSDTSHGDFDGLVLPGGVINPDKLRQEDSAIDFVKGFFKKGKPVGAICHGPQLLINADVVKGRTLTSYSSIKLDLKNSGANWVDKKVVVDKGLVTSRTPDDLESFNQALVEEFAGH